MKREGLFKRPGSPHWQMRYADEHGRIVRASSGTTSKKLAREILAKRKALVAEGRHLDVKRRPATTFFDLCDEYWNSKGKRLKMTGLDGMLKAFKAYFKNVRCDSITTTKVEAFLDSHVEKRGLAPSTRNRYLAQLKAIFNWGKRRKTSAGQPLVAHNPAAELRKTSERTRWRTRFLSVEEMDRLLSSCSDDFCPFIIAALHTGMRRSELFNLRWDDVNLRNRLIHVRDSKSRKPREIPIDDTLAATLKVLPSRFGKGYVFPSPTTGGKLTTVQRQFGKAVKAAVIENVRFHDLRHTFASHLVMNGVDIETVAELLGHASIVMTQRYAHLSPHHKTRAIKVLDTAYKTGAKTDTPQKTGEATAL